MFKVFLPLSFATSSSSELSSFSLSNPNSDLFRTKTIKITTKLFIFKSFLIEKSKIEKEKFE